MLAWRDTRADLPGVRAILDAYDGDPVLAKARAKDVSTLAHAAGLAPLDHPRGVAAGKRLRDEADAIVIDRAGAAQGRRLLAGASAGARSRLSRLLEDSAG